MQDIISERAWHDHDIKLKQDGLAVKAWERAKDLYENKAECDHPADLQYHKIVPSTEDWDGTALDGDHITVCRVCLAIVRSSL